MDPVRTLIIDDEPPARAKVRRFLAVDPEVEIAGEAGSGTEALDAVRELTPDLIFLDVQMPGLDGFEVLDALVGEDAPQVVFLTAFDEYAVRAFDMHAVDYLLKLFGPDRFERALTRAKERVRSRERNALDLRLREVLAELRPRPMPLERLLVPAGERQIVLEVGRIDWLEAEQNYVRLYVGEGSYLVRTTLSGLEARLDPSRFIRIHRSRIINADRVREVHPWSHGDQLVVLQDGTELLLSRRYRHRWSHLAP